MNFYDLQRKSHKNNFFNFFHFIMAPTADPCRIVGDIVHANATHVTNLVEFARRYGSKEKRKIFAVSCKMLSLLTRVEKWGRISLQRTSWVETSRIPWPLKAGQSLQPPLPEDIEANAPPLVFLMFPPNLYVARWDPILNNGSGMYLLDNVLLQSLRRLQNSHRVEKMRTSIHFRISPGVV